MISKDDEVMFRDAHDKLTLWLEKWDEFIEIRFKLAWYEITFKKYKKYRAHCSFCERFEKELLHRKVCRGCPLRIKGITCYNNDSLYYKVLHGKDKSALIEMIHIVDEAWEKARGE
jgi:hypothetical protein